MTTLSKAEAADLLHISERTLRRRMKAGVYKFTRTGEGQFAEVSFTYADIGLTEPEATPLPATVEVKRNPAPANVGHYEDEPSFAEKFKAGEATDSIGNDLFKPNPVSLLGPNPPVVRTPLPGLFEHMDSALLGGTDSDTQGQPIFDGASDNHPLNVRAIAEGKQEPTKAPASRHPNQTRQEALNLIFRDIRLGYSR
jgi:hypothetical protein